MKETRPQAKHLKLEKGEKYSLRNLFYEFLKIELFDGSFVKGWFVPDYTFEIKGKHYLLLPPDPTEKINKIKKNHIKRIYLRNGFYFNGKDIEWEEKSKTLKQNKTK
ncbi:hypothetical protein VO56_02185 [Mycoplasmopsis gallinacea]|uniref:Uncharacterized protein n=1 Tax=Mycoplasmopsis gallinacea TaxID=29556 RepID=A0A0D5ZJZ4_9BACT|nr:hypothetical protein VO56_02185 [Mycoplasmopsis gallinacea]